MKTKNALKNPSLLFLPLLVATLWGSTRADDSKTAADSTQAAQTNSPQPRLLIADFDRGRVLTLAETPCEPFNDSSLGGKSTQQISLSSEGAHASKGALQLTGKLTSDFQWGGFVGFRALIHKEGGPTNMSAFSGVQFYARGDGKKYRLLVAKDNVRDGNHFGAEFTASAQWALVQIPFSKLAQSPYFGAQVNWSPENVTAIGFMAQAEAGTNAEVRLELDDIAFYAQK